MGLQDHDYIAEKFALEVLERARADAASYRAVHKEAAMSTTGDAVRAFIAAWNAHSPEAVRDVFAAEGRLRDPSAPDGLTGPAIATSVQRTLERFPDVAFTLTSVLEGDDGRVAFEWLMRGTLASPDGCKIPVTLDGCDVCQVRNGKIVELRGYFDRAGIMQQLTAAPTLP
jgi:predicted ester cyclase